MCQLMLSVGVFLLVVDLSLSCSNLCIIVFPRQKNRGIALHCVLALDPFLIRNEALLLLCFVKSPLVNVHVGERILEQANVRAPRLKRAKPRSPQPIITFVVDYSVYVCVIDAPISEPCFCCVMVQFGLAKQAGIQWNNRRPLVMQNIKINTL